MTQTMLIAFDGSDEAKRAMTYAAKLLRPTHVEILTAWEPLHRQAARMAGGAGLMQTDFAAVVEHQGDSDPAYEAACDTCHEGIALAESLGLTAHGQLVESATSTWGAIVDAAQELKPDVIVTGTRALTGIKSILQSSTAENVINRAGLPVFVVPPIED